MNVRIFWVCAMECMCAQTRPWFILSSERVLLSGNGVRTHVGSKGKIPSTGDSGESSLLHRIMQDCEPNPFPTELFHPQQGTNNIDPPFVCLQLLWDRLNHQSSTFIKETGVSIWQTRRRRRLFLTVPLHVSIDCGVSLPSHPLLPLPLPPLPAPSIHCSGK